MLDNNFERDGRSERERPIRPADELGSLADREVPIAPVGTSDVINRWLDGESVEPAGLRGDAAKSVEFWRRLGEETDRRKRMMTPSHVQAKIMSALPPVASHGQLAPWFKKELRVSTAMLLGGALGLVALGAIIANALAR